MNQKAILVLLVAAGVVVCALAFPYILTDRMPSLAHLWRLGIVWSVAKYLLCFVGVWVTHLFSKSFIEVSSVSDSWQSELKHYLIGIAACGVIALSSAYYLGTHKEDDDPVFGGGDVVVDYEPTDDQRLRHGLVLFFCLCIPAISGMHAALQELRYKRTKTSAAIHDRIA